MKVVTYNLREDYGNSDGYYEKIEVLSSKIKKLILEDESLYLNELMDYIEQNKVEYLRTIDEYAIEFLMIGVMIKDYGHYGNFFSKSLHMLFRLVNKLGEKPRIKKGIDIVRGELISNVLCEYKNEDDIRSIKNLICWMDESGDFKEEVYRLKIWLKFLEKKDKEYCKELINQSVITAEKMEKLCENTISIYVKPLEDFLKNADKKYKDREDLIYCSKSRNQYYFNMVSAEIMNDVYKEKFLRCEDKRIFAPACMKQVEKECMSMKGEFGYECRRCNKSCNINKLNNIVESRNIKVCIIPHETIINSLHVKKKNNIGIIGIACIPNLMSGGWKAIRLGFIPQCILLDYCGCRNHWLDSGQMTAINEAFLKKRIE